MFKILSYLNRWRDRTLSDILSIPEPVPNCYKCGEPRSMYHYFSFRGHGLGVCGDCYHSLDTCTYCSERSLVVLDGMCSQCIKSSARLRGYSYKPDPIFHRVHYNRKNAPPLLTERPTSNQYGKSKPVLHFGHELECDHHENGENYPHHTGTTIASVINCIGKGSTGTENLLYTKEDGTCTLEVVSHPFSWNYWNQYGKEIFQTLFLKLRENNLSGYSAPDSGHHIHVSRSALKPTDIVKIMSFVYNPDNYDFILDISQRKRNKLRSWANPVMSRDAWKLISRIARGYYIDYDGCRSGIDVGDYIGRSTAVNLQNRQTIEFRIFRGTLNFQSFSKNFEFVRSLICWVRQTSLDVAKNGNGLKSYLSFVKKNRNDYESLCFFLGRRGYGKFQTISKRWMREHSGHISKLKFNSDKGELNHVYSNPQA
jgi:hypothetical protein